MPVEPEANELLTRSPLALLVAMLLDQQVPLERAFSAPLDLVRRLGHEPTVAELAEFDPDALASIFSQRPALHRYPRAMAARVQDLARLIMEQYGGDAAGVWAARQAAGGAAAGLGGGRRAVRGRGHALLGGGHHGRGIAGPGAIPQAGAEGRGQG
jgi:uncharacterized HhH-GPD family protein